MLSYQAIGAAHRGQRERGRTTDSSAGRRWMQTLRKLPTQAPKAKAARRKGDPPVENDCMLESTDENG